MTDEMPTATEIDEAAGTEDDEGVIQPSAEEILDPDPEHGDGSDDGDQGGDTTEA